MSELPVLDLSKTPDLTPFAVELWLCDVADEVEAGKSITTATDDTAPAEAEVYYPEYNASTKYNGVVYNFLLSVAGVLGEFEINEMSGEPYFPAIRAWFAVERQHGRLVPLIERAIGVLLARGAYTLVVDKEGEEV